jgi:hypothetical protein
MNWFGILTHLITSGFLVSRGSYGWLRCFLIFFLELLLDPKIVDLVSLNYGER